MTFLALTIYGLSTYRLAILLSEDDGPWGLFRRLRAKLKHETKHNTALRKSEVHKGIECIRCDSIWVAAPIAAYAMIREEDYMVTLVPCGDGFLLVMSLSMLAIILNRAFPKV